MATDTIDRLSAVCVCIAVGVAASLGCYQRTTPHFKPLPICISDCEDRECGPDGCGAQCGLCPQGTACVFETGVCVHNDSPVISGRILMEYVPVGVKGTHVVHGSAKPIPARRMRVHVVDGNGQVIGSQNVSGDDGEFSVELSREPDEETRLVLSTAWAPSGNILFAVLAPSESKPHPTDTLVSPVWAWEYRVGKARDVGDITIRVKQASSAMFLYLIGLVGLKGNLEYVFGGVENHVVKLAMMFNPGLWWGCGTCYASIPQQVEGGGVLDKSIFISGGFGGSEAWGWPVVLHEMGHYVADVYSRDDSPGGPHWLGQRVVPPFAWSEGFATFFELWTASRFFKKHVPFYFDAMQGFAIDYGNLGNSVRPAMDGGMDQNLDERFVTLALWSLWDKAETGEPDPAGILSTELVYQALASERFKKADRGYPGADLVDFLDASSCLADIPDMLADAANDLGFPYDGNPKCVQEGSLTARDATEHVRGRGDRSALPSRTIWSGVELPRPTRPAWIDGVLITRSIRLN